MGLVACPECGQGISEKAETCPKCGYPMRPAREPTVVVQQAGHKRPWGFAWRTRAELFGWPLIHVAFGRDGRTGKLRVARGIVAVGQFGFGLITFAQAGVGLLFGFGQAVAGLFVIAQLAIGYYFAVGQFAVGLTVIGQFALGKYVLAQIGAGAHVWSTRARDPEAVRHFTALWDVVKHLLGR
jgi:hypothetical protein